MKSSRPSRPLVRLLLAVVLVVGVTACSGGSDGIGPTALGGPSSFDVEFRSFTMVNDTRRAEGVRPELDLLEALRMVAREHSEAMRDDGFFGHKNPSDEAGLRDRLGDAGIGFSAAAENLAQVSGPSPADLAHNQLMGSASHRGNILNSRFSVGAVGVAQQGDTYWVTQLFVAP